jgi:hypothetical protein
MQTDDVRREIGEITASGRDIAGRVQALIERAFQSAEQAGRDAPGRMGALVSAVIDGAAQTVDRAAPEQAESALRQVIDGLGQGLQRTANATKLAVEEAASGGKAYAAHDLKAVASDLQALGSLLTETVERAGRGVFAQAGERATSLRQHAARTVEGLRPSIEEAAAAALRNPVGLAGDSATAAVNVAKQAAGSIFSGIGRLLGSAGDRLNPPKGGAGRG